ncbi:MAG: hypothetical protein U5J64_09995 [Halobacteriales archaeon]|nr:hypothetical protein [Halobacteriales archaeon]
MDIEKALKTGFEKTQQKNGLILIAVFFVISLVSTIASQSQAAQAMERFGQFFDQMPSEFQETPFGDIAGGGPLAFDLPSSLISLMNLGSSIAYIVAAIVAYRVFASDVRDKIPSETYSGLLMPTINGIIGGILFAILVVIGLILLIVPGIYLLVALYFFLIFIALEDDNFIEALQSSWGLTRGRRLSVFLLFVALLVVGIVVAIIGGIAGALVGTASAQLGAIVGLAINAAFTVFIFGAIVDAYYQLREEKPEATA